MEILARLGNVPMGFINRTTWAAQSSPSEPLINLHREDWDDNQLVPWIPISRIDSKTTWVDIVVNNLDEKGHPFHLVRICSSYLSAQINSFFISMAMISTFFLNIIPQLAATTHIIHSIRPLHQRRPIFQGALITW
jgi:hypothetical protein